ncbi:hypothetical protein Mapa_014251 [Marchantia paleacea]|nr:hypothetical protein Mapa_014251 [Marchantia paleacea]
MSSDDVVVSSSRRPVASIAPSIEKKLSVLKYHTGFLLYSICLIVFAVVGGRRGGAGAAESSLPCEDKGSIAVQGTAIRLHLAQDKTLRSMRNAISSRSRVIESGFSQGLLLELKVDVL